MQKAIKDELEKLIICQGRQFSLFKGKMPKENEEEFKKCLNCLARLFCPSNNSREVCIAIIKNKEKLLVASNDEKALYVREYIEELQKLIDSVFFFGGELELVEKNYNKLLEKAFRKIYDILESEDVIYDEDIKKTSKIGNFKNGITKYKEKLINLEEIKDCWREAFLEAKGKKNHDYENCWKYLLPVIDTNNIFEYVISNIRETSEIFSLIERGKISNDKTVLGRGHAEMKILDYLLKNQGNWTKGKIIYIGLSKLCCVPCQLMIDIVNDKEARLEVCGTHGYIYPNWWVPNFYQKELLDKLKSMKVREQSFLKIRETTSIIPASCLNFDQICDKWSEQKQKDIMIEIPPKGNN